MEGGQEQEARDQGIDTQTHADRRARTESVISFLSTDIFIAGYIRISIYDDDRVQWKSTMEAHGHYHAYYMGSFELEEKRKRSGRVFFLFFRCCLRKESAVAPLIYDTTLQFTVACTLYIQAMG